VASRTLALGQIRLPKLWSVADCSFLTGFHPSSIGRAIRAGELEAILSIRYRSRPNGQILRRRSYLILDPSLREWLSSKVIRRKDGQAWKHKPGRKPGSPVSMGSQAPPASAGEDW
jgi:hypothetical protein